MQFDYDSKKINEKKVKDVATITCRDGYLFIGEWKSDKEREMSCYFMPCYKDFYAHKYCKEEDFGGPIKELTLDENGRCIVGNTELYYHKNGFYANEPQLNDFPVTTESTRFF